MSGKPKTHGGDPNSTASLIERLAAVAVDARSLLGELHSAVKSARAAQREAQQVSTKWVDEQITAATHDGLTKLADAYDKARAEAFDRITASFDEIKDTLMGLANARDAYARGETNHRTMLEMCGELVDELVAPRCPGCNRPGPVQTSLLNPDDDLEPVPGNVVICFYCGQFNAFVNRYRYRPATGDEIALAMQAPAVQTLVRERPNGFGTDYDGPLVAMTSTVERHHPNTNPEEQDQ